MALPTALARTYHLSAAIILLTIFLPLGQTIGQTSDPSQAQPQPLDTRRDKQSIIRLEQIIPHLMAEGDIPGLSVALIRDASVAWSRGFGVKNSNTKDPVDANTVFEAASLSKPVFAYAVLKLVDNGKLSLDTPLTKYLPGRYDIISTSIRIEFSIIVGM